MFQPYKTGNLDPSASSVFRPRQNHGKAGYLSTPQKKLIIYVLTLMAIAFVIFSSLNAINGGGLLDNDESLSVRKPILRAEDTYDEEPTINKRKGAVEDSFEQEVIDKVVKRGKQEEEEINF